MIGYINSFESFGSADGPGVRFVVFMQGCKMRCMYCHNPETWESEGDKFTPDEIIQKALRYRNYWGDNGGITVSGGEPLLQLDFLIELFALAKKKNIHTAIDTSGQPFLEENENKFKLLFDNVDLTILDIKAINSELHAKLTGHSNKNILSFAKWLSDNNKKIWIRHVLVPNLTDSEEELTNIKEFVSNLNTVERIELLPYHSLGIHKWENLGIDYKLKNTKAPTNEEMNKAKKIMDLL